MLMIGFIVIVTIGTLITKLLMEQPSTMSDAIRAIEDDLNEH